MRYAPSLAIESWLTSIQRTDNDLPDFTLLSCEVGDCRDEFHTMDDLCSHLQETHGIVNGIGQVTNQTAPQFASNSVSVESPHATSAYQTSRELEEPTRQTSVPPRDGEDPVISNNHDLESHTKVLHPQKVETIFPPSGSEADGCE